MMLKDVKVSGTKVAWRSAAAPTTAAAAPAATAAPAEPMASAVAQPSRASPGGVAEPARPVWSPAAIAAWVADQPPEVQADVAAALSPLLAEHWMPELKGLAEREHARGYESGERRALDEVRERFTSALQTLGTAHTAAERAFDAELSAFGERCADIVLEALAKIGGPALATREAALGAVLNVVAKLRSEREVTLRVSAHDLEVLEANRGPLERAFAGRRFAMVADPRIELGGCIVESPQGSLDGRFETQLQGLIETLRAARSQPEVAR
jgi:flagellar biosynthesis/type III secretory pathway protein FliH